MYLKSLMKDEFSRGVAITKEILAGTTKWEKLFEPYKVFTLHTQIHINNC